MTRKEKINLIDEYCIKRVSCVECPAFLMDEDGDCMNTEWRTDEELDKAIRGIKSAEDTYAKDAHAVPETQPDMVNKPNHYQLPGGLECWDVLVACFGEEETKIWAKINAFTYLFRHKRKNGEEDIRKALVNLQKYFDLGGEKE